MKFTKSNCIPVALACLAGFGAILNAEDDKLLLKGAPPGIPHVIREGFECQHCHMINRRPGDDHLERSNCQQCHVSLASNEKHLMLDMDWDAFPGYWKAASIAAPEPEVHLVNTYEGAPPVIPHSTVWAGNCLDCHTSTMDSGPATTHPDRGNCTQCHVSLAIMDSRQFLKSDPLAFQVEWTSPVTALKQGRRNPAKLPTVIPHEIEGFEDCLMCHSPEDTMGLATTHPERNSCTQCHISTATTEGHKFLTQSLTELK